MARSLLSLTPVLRLLAVIALVAACDDEPQICEDFALPSRPQLRCEAELRAQAARPLDAALPGALTIKTIVDRADGDAVHFMDTATYPLHSRFAIDHLGWPPGAPFVEQ